MHKRVMLHVYEIMHMLYECKHAQKKQEDKQHMQNNNTQATCLDV